MSLSFEQQSDEDIPVARIYSREENKIVYLNRNKSNINLYNIPFTEESSKLIIGKTLNELIHALTELPPDLTEIKISPTEFISILPSPQPENIYLTGKKGWGKSLTASLYAKEYRNIFPDRKVYLFTRRPDDIAYNGVEIDEEIIVNEDVMNSGLTYEKLDNSLAIFDDLDNLTNESVYSWVHGLINESLSCGRKDNIHVIYISHLTTDYKRTRVVLNEADKVIFYNGGPKYQNREFLKRYEGLDTDQVSLLLSLDGWVCVSRSIPMYVIHQHGIFMLK